MEITNQDHNVDICSIGSDESGTGWNMITACSLLYFSTNRYVMDACQNRFIFFFSDDVGLSPPYLNMDIDSTHKSLLVSVIHT